jgi:hypothetical protein
VRLSYYTFLFAVIGIVATFLPWVHYPKGDTNLYGYIGDGLITGFLFCIVIVLSLIEIIKKKDIPAMKIANGIIGLLMLILSVHNILSIENQKANFETDNPFIGTAFAGFTQGSGLYALGVAGTGLLVINLIGFFKRKKDFESPHTKKFNFYLLAIFILSLLVLFFVYRNFRDSQPTKVNMEDTFKKDVEAMGRCLVESDYDCFIKYNHPMIIQGYGSKERMKDLLGQMMKGYREYQGEIKKIEFVGIHQVESNGSNIQAVIDQDVTLDKNGNRVADHQKVLAVSEDNGNTWYYINLTGTDKEKISRFYPELNKKLNF